MYTLRYQFIVKYAGAHAIIEYIIRIETKLITLTLVSV